jgi:hypothetical protein
VVLIIRSKSVDADGPDWQLSDQRWLFRVGRWPLEFTE